MEENLDKNEEKTITPYEYFQNMKGKLQTMDDERLEKVYQNAIYLAERYNRTGQTKGLRKLKFHIESIVKEKQILDAGINKFVYRSDIEEYIQDVADKQVVILDLKSYERNLPDEIIEALEKVKDLFDEFYIVCTDYTGEMARRVQEERREKDPILFGAFLDREKNAINERFYYIGDWIDDYCDLTLDKMVAEMEEETGRNILNDMLPIPKTQEELQDQLNSLNLKEDESTNSVKLTLISSSDDSTKKRSSFFTRIRTFFSKKND
mgnify:CR=1 FL=1